jgi:hypothetical protein
VTLAQHTTNNYALLLLDEMAAAADLFPHEFRVS